MIELAQITGTETEILAQMLNTEAGRLIGLALVLMCFTMLYMVISSSRFNTRLLTMTGSHVAALDRNTTELKAQDKRMDGYVERDFAHREQLIAATNAHVEVLREYVSAFLDMRSLLSDGVDTAIEKHEQTHGSLHYLKGVVESVQSAVTDLDNKITQELKPPLDQIIERVETLTAEIRQGNATNSALAGRVDEALMLMQSAKQILQLAAGRQRSTDEWKRIQNETNVASHTGSSPAADAGQPGTGGGSSTGHEPIGIDERTPVVVVDRTGHHRAAGHQPGDDPVKE